MGMMMGYDLGMMPVVSKCIKYCLVSQMHRQKCLVSKKGSHAIRIGNANNTANSLIALFTHVAHYIRLVLASHTGQKGYTKFMSISVMQEHGICVHVHTVD